MKILLLFLLLTLFAVVGFAQNTEELPEMPWRMIAETYNPANTRHWKNDINIKLFGNYCLSDSIMVANSIKQLNDLCETIQLKFSKLDRGNLEIYFLDSINVLDYKYILTLGKDARSQWMFHSRNSSSIGLFTQALNTDLIPIEFKQNYLTNTLAFALYPTFWRDKEYINARDENRVEYESIYRSMGINDRDHLMMLEMQNMDKKLLQAIFSKNFEENLEKALLQYPHVAVPVWLKASPKAFLLLPFAILLLLLLPVYLKIAQKLKQKVSNKILHFNCMGIIGILVLSIVFYFYFASAKAISYNPFYTLSLVHDLRAYILLGIIIGLPAINLLRLIEILIHKNSHKKTLKIGFIFLSTGLIPFATILGIFMAGNKGRQLLANDITIFSYIFMGCLLVAAFRALISYFFFKEKDLILENETKLSQLRELKTKAELNVLHSRINPHFLYNSLNSIAGLAHSNANKTEHMALSLSKLFRYSINKEKSDWTTFNEELEMVKIYLDVEKVRFDDRLIFAVEIDPELKEQKIPRFIIQPLVENAVKHGISKSVDGGEIKIKIAKDKKDTIIAVSDSGKAFPKDLTPGFGLQSIYDKLEILYKNKFEMSFTNSPLKQVTLKLK